MSDYVLKKRGLYYRPDYQGYTGVLCRAGRYTKEEALAHACTDTGVTCLPIDEAQEFSESCFDDIARKHLRSERNALREQIKALGHEPCA